MLATMEAPDPVNREVAYDPGDYAVQNRTMILVSNSWRTYEGLWASECKDSLNPTRSAEAHALEIKTRELREAAISFYTRWDLGS